jgi:sugar phosphate isomerase/epimerase
MRGAELGAVLTGFFPASVRDGEVLRRAIAVSAERGFGCVEFFYDGPALAAVSADLCGAGLSSVYHPAYAMKQEGLDLGAPRRADRERAVSRTKAWIEQAARCGCRSVMVLSGPELEDAEERGRAVAALGESLRELCSFAASTSPALGVSLEGFNNRGEPYLLMGPVARCLALAEDVGAEHHNFGFTFDLSHSLQLGEDPSRSAALISGWCRHVHLANCVLRDRSDSLYGDKHPPFSIPGGEVDEAYLAAFLRSLRKAGYFSRGDQPTLLGLEVITRPPATPEETLAEAAAAFGRAWNSAGALVETS